MHSKKQWAWANSSALAGRDKSAQQVAWRVASTSAKPVAPVMAIAEAKKLLKDVPVGSAVRLASGIFLKKCAKGKYDITSLQ